MATTAYPPCMIPSVHRNLFSFGPPEAPRQIEEDSRSLPPGFPTQMTTDLAWGGSSLMNESDYMYYLTDNDLLEIDKALTIFKDCGLDGDLVNCENFPLPHLTPILERYASEVHTGKGFFILRGLGRRHYSVADSTIVFLALSSFIGEKRARQDERGNMLVHIISNSSDTDPVERRAHTRHSSSSISFHTDHAADILAFHTRSSATRGGKCLVSSTHAIYNELVTTRPDVISVLAQTGWPFSLPYLRIRPILFYHDSKLIMNFAREPLLGSVAHPRVSTVPAVTIRQREALDIIDALAEKYSFEFSTQTGDIHFVNNLALLHRRNGFEDGLHRKRHLVRMHLRNKKLGWEIPPALKLDWEEAFGDGPDMSWHIMPMPDGFFPLRKFPN